MDLKGLISSLVPIQSRDASSLTDSTRIKSENTTDRDADGRQQQGQDQNPSRPMTDKELETAMSHLRHLQVFKENAWDLRLEVSGDRRFVIILDSNEKVLRRIPEPELWTLIKSSDADRGQLISKTA